MRKLIATINITVDGYCDHTAMIGDDDLHDHFTEVLHNAEVILYGRTTYQLMEDYWPLVVKDPTGNRSTDDFAKAIDNISKIVFSNTLESVQWRNTTLKKDGLRECVLELKERAGDPVLVGSPGLIATLTQQKLIDSYQLCVHPVIAGKGLQLFKGIGDKLTLKLTNTKTFRSGTTALWYEAVRA